MATKRELEIELAWCRDWFKAIFDGEHGVNWLNGDSDRYAGNGWDEAKRRLKALNKLLDH